MMLHKNDQMEANFPQPEGLKVWIVNCVRRKRRKMWNLCLDLEKTCIFFSMHEWEHGKVWHPRFNTKKVKTTTSFEENAKKKNNNNTFSNIFIFVGKHNTSQKTSLFSILCMIPSLFLMQNTFPVPSACFFILLSTLTLCLPSETLCILFCNCHEHILFTNVFAVKWLPSNVHLIKIKGYIFFVCVKSWAEAVVFLLSVRAVCVSGSSLCGDVGFPGWCVCMGTSLSDNLMQWKCHPMIKLWVPIYM